MKRKPEPVEEDSDEEDILDSDDEVRQMYLFIFSAVLIIAL